jgi:hypothetical protein
MNAWLAALLSGSGVSVSMRGDPGSHRHAEPDHVHPVDPGPPGVSGGRIGPGVPVGGLRLPGRTGVPVSVVAGHGVLAVATVTLVLPTMLQG